MLGDTETSKAIATIIVLIRHEIRTSDTGVERINLGDALSSSIGFVLLQRSGWERTEKALYESGAVESVWDVVILDQGDALSEHHAAPFVEDVSPYPRPRAGRLSTANRPSSFISTTGESMIGDTSPLDDALSVISNETSLHHSSALDTIHPESAFTAQLSRQLKAGSSVRIATESVLRNTVAVEIDGHSEGSIETPSGYTLIAVQNSDGKDGNKRKYIFRSLRRRTRRGSFDVETPVEEEMDLTSPTPVTPLSAPSHMIPPLSANPLDQVANGNSAPPQLNDDQPIHTTHNVSIKANGGRPRSPPTNKSQRRHSAGGYFDQQQSNCSVQPSVMSNDSEEPHSKREFLKKNIKRGTSYGKLVDFWNNNPRKRANKTIPDRGPPRSTTVDSNLALMSHAGRPPSPALTRSPWPSGASTPRQSFEMWPPIDGDYRLDGRPHAPRTGHRRKPSSVFSLKTNLSETSLVLRSENQKPSRNNVAQSLERNNTLPGQYPLSSFTANVARFARFSLAAYGSKFIRFTSAASDTRAPPKEEGGPLDRHQSFTTYTGLPDSTVLVSSYVDPEGGAHMEGHADAGMPLIHYISLDHESKAVVLTCRGTLGFEDVLIDMTCDYDTFLWQGKPYHVHKGMLASARRLLTLHSGRIIATIKAALEEFDDYGLILCGHSLGGGVCSILGMMISQPNPDFHLDSTDCSAFLTAQPPNGPSLISSASSYSSFPPHPADALAHTLPNNRPVHVYAYGPAASVSPALSHATRGLITTIINNADVVPYLSLGNIRDFQSIALAFKHDSRDAKCEMRKRVWDSIRKSISDKSGLGNVEAFFTRDWSAAGQAESMDEEWPWEALESLREGLTAPKLLPPGECFIVERKAVLQRFAFAEKSAGGGAHAASDAVQQAKSFKPASHIRVTHVKDVSRRFVELRFQASMFLDHMPSKYEKILDALEAGVA